MINLGSRLAGIERQREKYRILLNRSNYRKELQDSVWEGSAELAARFDLLPDRSFSRAQEESRKRLFSAFQMIRFAPKQQFNLELLKDAHACAMGFSDSFPGGIFRRARAHWLNSVLVLANWEKIPYLMSNLVAGINQRRIPAFYWEESPNAQFQRFAYYPVMQAIEANYNSVAIHPFPDGNKRAARLVSSWILDKYGHIPLSVYDREEYISGIETYYSTRHPQAFYDVMLDQMQKSYDRAITDAKAMEKRTICMKPQCSAEL